MTSIYYAEDWPTFTILSSLIVGQLKKEKKKTMHTMQGRPHPSPRLEKPAPSGPKGEGDSPSLESGTTQEGADDIALPETRHSQGNSKEDNCSD